MEEELSLQDSDSTESDGLILRLPFLSHLNIQNCREEFQLVFQNLNKCCATKAVFFQNLKIRELNYMDPAHSQLEEILTDSYLSTSSIMFIKHLVEKTKS
jgi:hypothetical protein